MEKAEAKAQAMGDLPRFEDSSVVDRIAAAAVPVATITYAVSTDYPWLTSVTAHIKSVFGF